MERDAPKLHTDWEFWDGDPRPGLFRTPGVNLVRQEWLHEGVVPRCSVRSFNEFKAQTASAR